MRAVVILGLVVTAGCGRLGFDAEGGGGGGSNSGPDGGTGPVGPYRTVTTSGSSACAIGSDDSLWCWGEDPASTTTFLQPTQIPGAWSDVTLAHSWADHACGIQTDGSLWCWGSDAYGMLGDNAAGDSEQPVHIGSAAWTSVSASGISTCGIQRDQSLWCWGQDTYGQLGDGQTGGEQDVPEQVAGSWASVSVGDGYACAVGTDSSLWCWGDDWAGQLGNGLSENNANRTQVAGSWLAVSASSTDDHTCAIATDHGVWCWGNNDAGELGTGDTSCQYSPVATGIQASMITVGDEHSCALETGGAVWCWGQASHGELATASSTEALAPAHVSDGQWVSAADDQTCIIDPTGHVQCTGRDDLGQLGATIAAPGEVDVPTRADTRTDWTSISAGGTHVCGSAGGAYYCWGFNSEGELGDGTLLDRQAPVALGGSSGMVTLVAGEHATIGLKADSTAWLWGGDDAAGADYDSGEQLAGSGWSGPAVGDEHACGLQGTALTCRGDDSYGQLGDGNTSGTSTGAAVPGTWLAVAAGGDATCALSTTHALSCWGDDSAGQVGNPSGGVFATPQAIAVTQPTWVGVGGSFACAIDSAGQLWCWGSNSCGQLGNGTRSDDAIGSAPPVAAGTRTDWLEVSLGDQHACAIPSDHSLWCWGHGGEGAVGNPDLDDLTEPTQIGTDADWAHVAAGDDFTCALKTDGTRWCFGSNDNGELGNGLAWNAGFVPVL